MFVDTLGLLLAVLVHEAGGHDSQCAPWVRGCGCPGWRGSPPTRATGARRVSGRPPRSWSGGTSSGRPRGEGYRRLSKDHEWPGATSEAMVQLVMARLVFNRVR